MSEMTLFVPLIAILVASAIWALIVMGRSRLPRRNIEQPSADNGWQNEQYAEHVMGGKLRSQSVSPQDTGSA